MRWWKQMLAVVIVSMVITGVVTFLKPQEYVSVATAVPASSFGTDKSSVFNQNIEALYSALGTIDDLDLVVGTGKLDTVYLFVTDQFNLFDHYKMGEKGEAARTKAASLLKSKTKVLKSEYGELKVKVWDTDKNLAPQLANAIMDKLNDIHRSLHMSGSQALLKTIERQLEGIAKSLDSMLASRPSVREALDEHNRQLEKLQNEYKLILDFNPPVLIPVEKARMSEWPDKPKRAQIMVATTVLSFLFALFAALIIERRKTLRR
jgi:uncharacterized protein involved in exopolysaccharide biosynthesis